MYNHQVRCKNCGRPLSKDEQQNFFSFCYDCFRYNKSSQIRKATAMRIIGIIGLIFVSLYIFAFSNLIGFMGGFYRPLRAVVFIIGCLIAILIPLLLVVFGTKKKRKWSIIFKAKPIEPQEVISVTSKNAFLDQKKFCPECGNKIVDKDQKFCVNCGTELF